MQRAVASAVVAAGALLAAAGSFNPGVETNPLVDRDGLRGATLGAPLDPSFERAKDFDVRGYVAYRDPADSLDVAGTPIRHVVYRYLDTGSGPQLFVVTMRAVGGNCRPLHSALEAKYGGHDGTDLWEGESTAIRFETHRGMGYCDVSQEPRTGSALHEAMREHQAGGL